MDTGYIIGRFIGFAITVALTVFLFTRAMKLAKTQNRTAWQTIRMVLYFILSVLLVLGTLGALTNPNN